MEERCKTDTKRRKKECIEDPGGRAAFFLCLGGLYAFFLTQAARSSASGAMHRWGRLRVSNGNVLDGPSEKTGMCSERLQSANGEMLSERRLRSNKRALFPSGMTRRAEKRQTHVTLRYLARARGRRRRRVDRNQCERIHIDACKYSVSVLRRM